MGYSMFLPYGCRIKDIYSPCILFCKCISGNKKSFPTRYSNFSDYALLFRDNFNAIEYVTYILYDKYSYVFPKYF